METNNTPRIYVACLASYNNGTLYGKWIDVNCDADELTARILEVLKGSPTPGAEEWAIHDHEGFSGVEIGEYPDLEDVCKLAKQLTAHGELFARYLDGMGGMHYLDEAIEGFEERYQGAFRSLGDWAERMAEDCGDMDNIPEAYQAYIDWEKKGQDAELGGDIDTFEVDGEIHIFWTT